MILLLSSVFLLANSMEGTLLPYEAGNTALIISHSFRENHK